MGNIFTRSKFNPIIKPNPGHEWESLKVYNPGAVFYKGKYHLFYRAIGEGKNWRSSLGYAVSKDGEHFKRFSKPIFDRDISNPREFRGFEDPRITQIGNTFYMSYTVYDGKVARLHIATSSDLKTWKRGKPAFKDFNFTKEGGCFIRWKNGKPFVKTYPNRPEMNQWTKSGAIFPEKINGKYWMLFNEFRIWIATSDNGRDWKLVWHEPFIKPRENTKFFDNVYLEMGPPPIKTERGWIVLYHGVNDSIQYQLGVLLLDLKNPTKILYRSEKPIFGPKEIYEMSGIVDIIPGATRLLEEGKEDALKKLLRETENKGFMPKVTFVTAAILKKGTIRIYYGAGDQFICTATTSLKNILATIP